MSRCTVAKIALLIMAGCMIIAVVGCGGGGGTSSGVSLTGSLSGSVFVPSSRSGDCAAFVTLDKSGAPSGYSPMVGATVTVVAGGRTYTTTTDANGHFLLSGLPTGTASVRITPQAGSGYSEFTTSALITAGSSATIGQDGSVSLITGSATSLGITVNSVDTSDWPIVRTYVSVLDPKANAAIIGLASGDFSLQLNDNSVSATVTTQTTTGDNPRQVYVLTSTMSGSKADFMRAEISATYCGKTGSGTGSVGTASAFIAPLGSAPVSYGFKDSSYASAYPGKWHMGADITADEGTRVNAAAKGIVVLVVSAMQDTGVVIKHRVTSDLAISGGTTRDIYVLYGCINPCVAYGDVVEPGQKIGTLRLHADGSRLHLGLRVGESITSAWGNGSLVNGQIPAADANGLTNGWTDPIAFFSDKTPDNTWDPQP